MKLEAHAKVNLFLRITGRRPDGYHLLRTVFWPVSLYDTIEIERTGTPGIRLSCSDPSLENENNLALKAVQALRSAAFSTRQSGQRSRGAPPRLFSKAWRQFSQ